MEIPRYILAQIAEAREKQDRAVARGDWEEALRQMDRQLQSLEEAMTRYGVLAERPPEN